MKRDVSHNSFLHYPGFHGRMDGYFSFFDSEEQFMNMAAKTPRSNCVLDTSKAHAAGILMTPVHDALEKALSSWQWAKD